MIAITNDIKIPSCWEDLTSEQVAATLKHSFEYLAGKFDLYEYRFLLLKLYTGYERSKKKFTDDEAETINSNLFFIADKIKFPIRPVYDNPKLLEVLSPELQEKLQFLFPFEVTEPNELAEVQTVFEMLKYRPVLNLNFKTNPIKQIEAPKGNYTGAVFNIDKHGDVQTNITAAMFCDAYDYYNNFNRLKEQHYLNILIAILYQPEKHHYSLYEAQLRADDLKKTSYFQKMAVYYWFQGVMEWLFAHPVYGMLFSGGKKETGKKINLGMSEILFSLSKEGYGTATELENEDMMKFLARQIKRLKDLVGELRGLDLPIGKIAEKTGLNVETINSL